VPRGSGFSAQTLLVQAALSAQPADWRHGYDLAKETGLKSGTLYPILVRLADRGLVEARWEDDRLSSEGLDPARSALAAVPAAGAGPGPASRRVVPRRRGLAGEGL
jgi:PadR family transcriptional regulator PadR